MEYNTFIQTEEFIVFLQLYTQIYSMTTTKGYLKHVNN